MAAVPVLTDGPPTMSPASSPSPSPSPWADACLAACLFAVDPAGLGGVSLRAQAGPVRDRWLGHLRESLREGLPEKLRETFHDPIGEGAAAPRAPRPIKRVPLHIQDERLLGGLDLAATLQAGRPVAQRGVLAEADGGVVLLAMAERLTAASAGRIAAVMDRGEVVLERDGVALRSPARFGVVALDEGQSDDEATPATLRDRLAFFVSLDDVALGEAIGNDGNAGARGWSGGTGVARGLVSEAGHAMRLQAACRRLPGVQIDDASVQALCAAALALGIDSLRASLLAVRAARVAAAWAGRDTVADDDTATAARLVLAPRATRLPAMQDSMAQAPPDESEEPPASDPSAESPADPPADPPPDQSAAEPPPASEPEPEPPQAPSSETMPLDDQILEAARAAIPAGLLAQLKAGEAVRSRLRSAGRSGARQQGGARGRPIGARRGEPRAGARLNVIETLRAAVPWQKLRQRERALSETASSPMPPRRIEVRQHDFHVTRIAQRSETTTLFVVDASGSAAMHRLAEAKGAVELLLADCYVRRDRVAVLAFRGRGTELLLPPTRSLVRAKRSLAGLPGGGGTPLASALDAAAALADGIARRGETPLVVFLTDGRANVCRDGSGGRARAEEEALDAARQWRQRAAGCAALLVDTSPQPQPQAQRLAQAMLATYLPLPYAGAQDLNRVLRAGTG